MSFDTQRFIEEIEKRPAIWNSDSPDYSDRALKVKCWQEIVHLFQDREDMKVLEKKQLGDSLQRKWKGIRGCFTRELNRQKSLKTGAVGPRKSEYIYFQQLQFLKNVVTIKEPGLEEEDGEEERDLCIAQISTKRTAVDDETEEYLYNRPNRSKRPKINEDRLFLLSLVGSLNKIPEEIKMGTKIKIMQLLDEAIQGGDDNQHQQPIVYRNTHSYSDSD